MLILNHSPFSSPSDRAVLSIQLKGSVFEIESPLVRLQLAQSFLTLLSFCILLYGLLFLFSIHVDKITFKKCLTLVKVEACHKIAKLSESFPSSYSLFDSPDEKLDFKDCFQDSIGSKLISLLGRHYGAHADDSTARLRANSCKVAITSHHFLSFSFDKRFYQILSHLVELLSDV
jgi:hypothetical protein